MSCINIIAGQCFKNISPSLLERLIVECTEGNEATRSIILQRNLLNHNSDYSINIFSILRGQISTVIDTNNEDVDQKDPKENIRNLKYFHSRQTI